MQKSGSLSRHRGGSVCEGGEGGGEVSGGGESDGGGGDGDSGDGGGDGGGRKGQYPQENSQFSKK